ncbi:MAG: hypothetical protein JWQ25_630, partial [Daejeonella sp.]|nr:hypothetical protein [Daejeonella sp.]
MKIVKVAFIVWISLYSISVNAQRKAGKKTLTDKQVFDKIVNDAKEKLYGKTVKPPKEYIEAETLVQKAIEALNKGEVNKADSLIYSSIKLYPTR